MSPLDCIVPEEHSGGAEIPLLEGTAFHALRELGRDDTVTQRDLAQRVGVSLGRANVIVRSLIRMGLVKARRFKNSRNKLAYRYVLTPAGIRQRVLATRRHLDERLREYEELQRELEQITAAGHEHLELPVEDRR